MSLNDGLLAQVILPILVGGLGLLLLERLLVPIPSPIYRRSFHSGLLTVGTWLLLYTLLMVIEQRPWFTVMALLALQILLVLVNQAKYDSLREPFIFQDFEYFTDVIKHPRLYLPFLGVFRTLLATIAFVSALVVGLLWETPLWQTLSFGHWLWVCAVLGFISIAFIRTSFGKLPEMTFNPHDDLTANGQITAFWQYWREEKSTRIDPEISPFSDVDIDLKADKANIVVVQSESFFDPRSLYPAIKSSVLNNYDQATAAALLSGKLTVPAWGANTVRTECAFLTGLTETQLGIHKFNPYRQLAQQGIPNLASHLKKAGYKTVCVHPYPASFYLRDKVFPNLGFDRFIDDKAFTQQDKSGQFIGDLAVAEHVRSMLADDNEKPLFIFVITMENHGPLHLETPFPGETELFYEQAPPEGLEDLTVYLRHLANADKMIPILQAALFENNREGILCWYGDHVPIMQKVYQRLNTPGNETDYFIWKTARQRGGQLAQKKDLAANELAGALLLIRPLNDLTVRAELVEAQ